MVETPITICETLSLQLIITIIEDLIIIEELDDKMRLRIIDYRDKYRYTWQFEVQQNQLFYLCRNNLYSINTIYETIMYMYMYIIMNVLYII